MTCKGITVLCVNNTLLEKNTNFLFYSLSSAELVIRKFSIVYIVAAHGTVEEGSAFYKNFDFNFLMTYDL